MTGPSFEQAVPVLRIFDEARAREFYVGFLGFTIDWEHRFEDNLPIYMQVSRGGCRLHLSEHHGDGCPGAAIRIPMRGIAAFVAELNAREYRYARPGIESKPWGSREAELTDPFGNRLTFSEPIEPP